MLAEGFGADFEGWHASVACYCADGLPLSHLQLNQIRHGRRGVPYQAHTNLRGIPCLQPATRGDHPALCQRAGAVVAEQLLFQINKTIKAL